MSFRVTLVPSGRQFSASRGELVLDAALRQGVVLPYGCRDGSCGTCKAQVVSGAVERGTHMPPALGNAQAVDGQALLCCSRPLSDLSIEVDEIPAVAGIEIVKLVTRVVSLERAAPDVAVLRLQIAADDKLRYLPGQHVEVLLRGGSARPYSLASSPETRGPLELHIRHLPGGLFTDTVFGLGEPALKERDVLRLKGPLGTFFLRDSRAPVILVASGTGFAPIKAIVESAVHQGCNRPMTLYWGGRRPHDLYMDALCRQWTKEIAGFHYVPVISEALPQDAWHGRGGFVHRAVMEDFADLSGHEVYACGAPVVVDSARRAFMEERGLRPGAFFSDSFVSRSFAAPTSTPSPLPTP